MSNWRSAATRLMRSAPPPQTAAVAAEIHPSLLLVDDEPEIRETLTALFEESGYPILEASNGEEALKILRDSRERLIILLDNFMPLVDGEGVLRAILRDRKLRRRHAIILVSAMPHLSRRLSLQRLLHSLSIETISKPFNIIDLEQAVERARVKLLH